MLRLDIAMVKCADDIGLIVISVWLIRGVIVS